MKNETLATIVQTCRETVEHRVLTPESPYRICTLYKVGETLPPHGPLRCPYLGKLYHHAGEDVFGCYNGRVVEDTERNALVKKVYEVL